MTDDIQVDTPLGKTVGEVEQSVTGIEVFGPMGDQTILALCAALRKVHEVNKILAAAPDTAGFQAQREHIAALEAEVKRLREFAQSVVKLGWGGEEIDAGDVQEHALKAGLLRTAPDGYDPEKHGPSEYCEPGDEFYEFTFDPEAVARGGE